jgi:hypothetical protein
MELYKFGDWRHFMDEKDVFREALNNFTFDVASGGAIAHLADSGFMPREIQKRLDFPTPYERVREAYLRRGILRRNMMPMATRVSALLSKIGTMI